jgi:hypothetical protein
MLLTTYSKSRIFCSVDYFLFLFSYNGFTMSRFDRPTHKVYCSFMLIRGHWSCQFLEPDLRTSLPRTLTFADPEKIRELARRGEAWGTSESRQMLENGIESGRGGIYLKLTPEQYARLKHR